MEQSVRGQLREPRLIHEEVFGVSHDNWREETKKDLLARGKVSLLGFPKLHTLHLPLEAVSITLDT